MSYINPLDGRKMLLAVPLHQSSKYKTKKRRSLSAWEKGGFSLVRQYL